MMHSWHSEDALLGVADEEGCYSFGQMMCFSLSVLGLIGFALIIFLFII